jgi:hypothetical protein
MSERKVAVPEGMLTAAQEALRKYWAELDIMKRGSTVDLVLEAGLQWLTDDKSIVSLLPPDALTKIRKRVPGTTLNETTALLTIREGLQEMFVSPESKMPEEIEDLLLQHIEEGFWKPEVLNQRIYEAFLRGQKAGSK